MNKAMYGLLLFILFRNNVGAQDWFKTLVDNDSNTIYTYSFFQPAINSNALNEVDVLYTIESDTNEILFFKRSLDKGRTFLDRVIVDGEPIPDTYYFDRYAGSIQYDQDGNIIAIYSYCSAPNYYHNIKKSYDNGLSFVQTSFNYHANIIFHSFVFDENWVSYLLTGRYDNQLLILKSNDQGLSFSDFCTINRGNYRLFGYPVYLVKVGLDSFLTFWAAETSSNSKIYNYYNLVTNKGQSCSFPAILDSTIDMVNFASAVAYRNYVFTAFYGRSNSIRTMYFKKSEDHGNTFSEKIVLQEYFIDPEIAIFPNIKFNPNYGICVAFDGYNNGLLFFRSTDLGQTFTKTVVDTEHQLCSPNAMVISDSGDIYIASIEEKTRKNYLYSSQLITSVKTPFYKSARVAKIKIYPNPFNTFIKVSLEIYQSEEIKIIIYDVLGRKIRTLINRHLDQGVHEFYWNGENDREMIATSGIYYISVGDGLTNKTIKAVFIK